MAKIPIVTPNRERTVRVRLDLSAEMANLKLSQESFKKSIAILVG
jgi:hypothetical protein